ncbi:DNA relaxase NicK [Neisseria perflava]|uniref:replication initiation factor domain-containing protein n=1 Tax=Neisseria perflava TaxID=33053 RepID=UPI00209CF0AB|nr:replication initiation factor domain-containing protein [Neisseria perflava]MCP1773454.1 DNA relaxase NicK [Neisseria perflava]
MLLDSKGRLIEVPLRRGRADSAFIDQISFTFHEDTLCLSAGIPFVSDEEFIKEASFQMHKIFGFGITEKAKHKGNRFYDACWLMNGEQVQYGSVHFGGQNDTMLVELTATGCTAAKEGWELRLYEFISKAVKPKITRVDVAKDFFNAEYTPEQAKQDRLDGLFTSHHVMPKGRAEGYDWDSNDNSGKTYYIGSRESSKFTRVYEKGKQLGDSQSPWVRFEIEFKAKDIVIPFDVLKFPGQYWGGAYPVCKAMSEVQSDRMETKSESLEISIKSYYEFFKKQVGRGINGLLSLYPEKSKEQLFDEFLKPEHDFLPKKLAPEAYAVEFSKQEFLHEQPKSLLADFLKMFDLKKEYERDICRLEKYKRWFVSRSIPDGDWDEMGAYAF